MNSKLACITVFLIILIQVVCSAQQPTDAVVEQLKLELDGEKVTSVDGKGWKIRQSISFDVATNALIISRYYLTGQLSGHSQSWVIRIGGIEIEKTSSHNAKCSKTEPFSNCMGILSDEVGLWNRDPVGATQYHALETVKILDAEMPKMGIVVIESKRRETLIALLQRLKTLSSRSSDTSDGFARSTGSILQKFLEGVAEELGRKIVR